MKRNSTIRSLLSFIALFYFCACNENAPITYPDPNVTNAPKAGYPFVMGTNFSLKDYGYQSQEFFFRGEAKSYVNIAPLGSDGKWEVEPANAAIYKSRMLVYRPINPEDFNGTVIVEWMNVTGGLDTATDWLLLHNEILRGGYAWVGVSAQYVGVEGGDTALPTPLGTSLPLKLVNPVRYWSLSHPGDSFSYDIFAQAGRAIRYPSGIAPLGELKVQKMIAIGESQSATYMVTFINAFDKISSVYDGYFIHSRLGPTLAFGGASGPLSQTPQEHIVTPQVVKIREDLGKPVMTLQAETDVIKLGFFPSRQEDSSTFRLWEITGTAHADLYIASNGANDKGGVSSAKISIAYSPNFFLPKCPEAVNSAPQHHFVGNAALNALHTWLVDGVAPASAPRLAINTTGDGFERDALGIALGGVRSPYVDAPIAIFSGDNSSVQDDSNASICFLCGQTEMLDDTTIQSLYPDHASYISAVKQSAQKAVAGGYLMQEDANLIIQAAEENDIFQ